MGRFVDPCTGSMKIVVLLALSCLHSFKEFGRGLWFPQGCQGFPFQVTWVCGEIMLLPVVRGQRHSSTLSASST